jgi:restriction system protein
MSPTPTTQPVTTIWVIRAGETGDADALFLSKNVVALSLGAIGSLKAIAPPRRAALKLALLRHYPQISTIARNRNAGQLFRFFQSVQVGDLMVYPSRVDRKVHIGRVTGSYYFDEGFLPKYPHRRSVAWLTVVSRDVFSPKALLEMGAATTFFQIRRHVDEFRAAYLAKYSLGSSNAHAHWSKT